MSMLSRFIPGNNINNSLYKAIFSGDIATVSEILDSVGVSYSASWAHGYDLVLTALESKRVDVARLLIDKGCNIDRLESGSKLLLQNVIKLGDVQLLTMLLDRYTESMDQIVQANSLLHVAVAEGEGEIVNLLLQRGADIEQKGGGGMTPLNSATVRGHINIVEQLLGTFADIEGRDDNGKTSLFLAVSSGNLALVKILLKFGADVTCVSKNGQTPLLDASSKGHLEIVKDLLAYGADHSDKNNFGKTPLHIACMLQNKNLVYVLLNAGADVNATDNVGMVPCDAIAKKISSHGIIFSNPSISYLFGKHIAIMKTGGFHLNQRNEIFYDTFYKIYGEQITSGGVLFSEKSAMLHETLKNCNNEISLMKNTKSSNRFTAFDVFQKLKTPLSVTSENELNFLQLTVLRKNLCTYKCMINNLVHLGNLRNNLITAGQKLFSCLTELSGNHLPVLPEEMQTHIVSFLSNDELKQLICFTNELQSQTDITGDVS